MKQLSYQKDYSYDLKAETEEHIVPITLRTYMCPVPRSNDNTAINANVIFGGKQHA